MRRGERDGLDVGEIVNEIMSSDGKGCEEFLQKSARSAFPGILLWPVSLWH